MNLQLLFRKALLPLFWVFLLLVDHFLVESPMNTAVLIGLFVGSVLVLIFDTNRYISKISTENGNVVLEWQPLFSKSQSRSFDVQEIEEIHLHNGNFWRWETRIEFQGKLGNEKFILIHKEGVEKISEIIALKKTI